MIFVIAALISGIMLGLSVRAVVLVPATALATGAVLAILGFSLSSTLLMTSVWVALQIGYFSGAVAAGLLSPKIRNVGYVSQSSSMPGWRG
jgi:hypothetical protein